MRPPFHTTRTYVSIHTDVIASVYCDLRSAEAELETGEATSYTTPRTLMSILRLSQAVAKLRFDDRVCQSDVDEALRLMKMSKVSITQQEERRAREDPITTVYRKVKEAAKARRQTAFTFAEIAGLVRTDGIEREDILQAVDEYASIAVWTKEVDAAGNPTVTFGDVDAI
jgi:DNA replication licensing factor MCM7